MALERTICCCGASTWTRVFAWIQIVVYGLFSILSIVAIVSFEAFLERLKSDHMYVNGIYDEDADADETVLQTIIILIIVMPLLGLTMNIMLLIGTLQKRVCLLIAWLIYACLSLASAIVSLVFGNTLGGAGIGFGIVALSVNVFVVVVVCIHVKEIKEGVFDQKPMYSPVYV